MFENKKDRKIHEGSCLPNVEIKNCNVMIDGKNFFDQPVKSNMRIYDTIWKIATGNGDDYTTSRLLDHSYFNEHYKMVAIDISKQQALDADSKAIQQINFTENSEWDNGVIIIFIIKKAKETVLKYCDFIFL